MTVYKYYEGYSDARKKVLHQDMQEDLSLIDSLLGRQNLSFGDGPNEVKEEALRQLENRVPCGIWIYPNAILRNIIIFPAL